MKKYKSESFCNHQKIIFYVYIAQNTKDNLIILIKSELNHSFYIHPIYIKQSKAFIYNIYQNNI